MTKPRVRVVTGVVGVLAAATYAIERGVAYLPGQAPDRLPEAIEVISFDLGLTLWAIVWLAAAALALVGLFTRNAAWVFGVAGVAFTWSLAYRATWLMSMINGTPSRDYLNAGSYSLPAVALLLWAVCQPPWGRTAPTPER